MKKQRIITALSCMGISLIFAIINFSSVGAKEFNYSVGTDSVLDKIVMKNISDAYLTGFVDTDLTINELERKERKAPLNKDVSCDVPMPNTVIEWNNADGSSKSGSPTLSCFDFFTGTDNFLGLNDQWSGISQFAKMRNNTSVEDFSSSLTGIGYEMQASTVTTKCLEMDIRTYDDVNPTQSYDSDNMICGTLTDDGDIEKFEEFNTTGEKSGYKFNMEISGGKKYNISFEHNMSTIISSMTFDDDNLPSWESFVSQWQDAIYDGGYAGDLPDRYNPTVLSLNETSKEESKSGGADVNTRFKLSSLGDLLEPIFGKSSPPTLSTSEVFNIYNKYLSDTTKVKTVCDDNTGSYENDSRWYRVQLKQNGKINKNCFVRESNSDTRYTGGKRVRQGSDSFFFTQRNMTLEDIVDQINSFDLESILDEIDDKDNPTDLQEGGSDTKEVNCQNSGAAKNLGWIICPVLSFISEQVQNLYDDLIVPALEIKPGLIGGEDSDNDNAYQAWTIFQGFANTIFIIFFLVIIFSQVTGVGIDNYGIKKILPKLIIAAILVNLSYVICQVCVDLSNIVGNGIQTLFNGIPVTINATIDGKSVATAIGSTMISAVGIAVLAYAAYITVALWILPLIVALIGAMISILFLFVLLAGRQAIVVLLVVISPVAFICYLLPNTKKLFDKYVKIGEVMLLLYPICSLMVAGGGYVSKLFLSLAGSEDLNLFYTLAAMLISIVPIFFIPKVVKSSFNALGSMGASISGFGARLSGRAKGAIKGSGAYKAGQERLGEFRAKRRAGIGRDGQPIDMTLGQRLRRGSFTNRGIAKARAQYNKDQSARLAEDLLLDSDYMANAAIHRDVAASNEREKMYSEIFNRETDRNKVKAELGAALAGSDAERASASLNALIKKGGIDEALGELRNAGWSSMNSGVRDRVLQAMGDSGVDAMKAFSIYRNSGGTDSFKNWAKGTAADRGTAKYGSYAGYLQQKGSGAMNGYGKDEMQFVKSLQNSLASGMGAGDFGRMIGNAGINSNDAQARAEANNIIRQQIGSGAMTAANLGLSAEGVSAMSKGMSDAVVNGYNDYIANTYPGSSYAQTPGAAEAMARTAFSQQINDIRSDNTGRLLGKMDPNTRKNLGL